MLSLGQGPGLEREAAQISWDNERSQAMACRLLGLPGDSLPLWASSQGVCSMLGLRFLFTASDIIHGGWAEAAGSDHGPSERLPSESNTATALWMGDEPHQSALAAGLVKAWAEASGGAFKCNGVEPAEPAGGWAAQVSALMEPFDLAAMPQRDFSDAYAKDVVKMSLPTPGGGQALVDLRSAARAMGCPMALSLAAPEHKSALCWERIQSELSRQARLEPAAFAQAFSACFVELGRPGDEALARQQLQARQEAQAISEAAGPAHSPKARPRV